LLDALGKNDKNLLIQWLGVPDDLIEQNFYATWAVAIQNINDIVKSVEQDDNA
jgi:hypothetical protein